MNYFNNLPSVVYNGHTVKNLLCRARLSPKTAKQPGALLPYYAEESLRADQISNLYYDSPAFTWLVWMSNYVIDPYYDLAVSDNDFLNFIKSKYGSVELASRKIAYYRSNWRQFQDEKITVAAYDAIGIRQAKQFYTPIYNEYGDITSYRRKFEDLKCQTNKIVSLTLSNITGEFITGEEIQRNGTNYAFAVGPVVDSTITVQHVTGTFDVPAPTVTGIESNATATVTQETTIYETITDDDTIYWEPITYFEIEEAVNTDKKEMRLLSAVLKNKAENELLMRVG